MERFKHQSGMTLGVTARRPFRRFFTAWTGVIMMEKFRFWIDFGGDDTNTHREKGRQGEDGGSGRVDAAASYAAQEPPEAGGGRGGACLRASGESTCC